MHEVNTNYIKEIEPSLFIRQELIAQFICPLCEGVLIIPTMCMCGCLKLFCKNCFEKYLKTHENKCLISGNKITQEPKFVKWVQSHIELLEMKCKNQINGCNWTGQYSKFKEHIGQCSKESIHCLYEGCDKSILRENLDKHMFICQFKPIKCEFCGLKIVLNDKEKHDLVCLKKEISCPKDCGEKFERCELDEHLNKCKKSLIDCPFKEVGCLEKFERNNIDKMNQSLEMHLNLLLEDYKNFKNKIIKKLGVNQNDFNNNVKININKNELNFYNNNKDKEKVINLINNKNIENNIFKKNITEQKEQKSCSNSKKIQSEIIEKLDDENIEISNFNEMKYNIHKGISHHQHKELIPQKMYNSFLSKKREEPEIISSEENINPFLSLEEKNKNIYNIKDLHEGFKITGNIVSSNNSLEGNQHFFVFAHDSKKIKYNQNGTFTIRFNILQENKWLALGLCDKKVVEDNKFIFAGKTDSNGCFIISTNKITWHCSDKKQRKKIKIPDDYPSLQSKNIEIECRYTPFNCLLEFYVDEKFLISLENVKPIKSEYLTPCIIFLKNCEIQTSYEYPH